jgi:succinate-acetate transporter protein
MAEIAQFERYVPEHESWTRSGPVNSHLEEQEIEQLEERSVATIADPGTLGLWGFATGTWIVGTVFAGWFPQAAFTATVPVLLVFAGIVQFIAGLYAFRRANVLAATAFCAFGAFSVTIALMFALQAGGAVPTAGYSAVLSGFLLESFGFIALALMVAALRMNAALVAILGLLAVGYALSGIPNLANAVGQPGWSIVSTIGGCFLIASALCAYYAGMALVVNSTWKRSILPLGGKA